MTDFSSGLGWPPASQDLLIRAALLPEDDARRAWHKWTAEHDIETTSWAEVRLLAAVGRRADLLASEPTLAGRVKGIRRFVWAQTQGCLVKTRPALETLHEAGIPMLLFKGAARVAVDPASAADRMVLDIDALVPFDRAIEAFDTLAAGGWELWGWQIERRPPGPIAACHAWSLRRNGGEIDLHHVAHPLDLHPGADKGLWHRSTKADLLGVPVAIPCPTDALLLTLAHGMRYSPEGTADWAIDAAALLDGGRIDWDLLAAEAHARRLEALIAQALSYLAGPLGRPVDDRVRSELNASVIEPFRSELQIVSKYYGPVSREEVRAFRDAATARVRARAPSAPAPPMRRTAVLSRRWHRIDENPSRIIEPVPATIELDDEVAVRISPHVRWLRWLDYVEFKLIAPGLELEIWDCDARTLLRSFRSGLVTSFPAALLRERRIEALEVSVFEPTPRRQNAPAVRAVSVTWIRHAAAAYDENRTNRDVRMRA